MRKAKRDKYEIQDFLLLMNLFFKLASLMNLITDLKDGIFEVFVMIKRTIMSLIHTY